MDRKLQESIDKRNAAVMELERKHRAAVEALKGIALRHADGSLCFDGCDKAGLQEPSPFCARYQQIMKDVE